MALDTILANVSQLNTVLLDTDEEGYDNIAIQSVQALKKLKIDDANQILQILTQIDPSSHTIPFIFLLAVLIEATSQKNSRQVSPGLVPEGKAWPEIARGLLAFDPIQARYVGNQLSRVVEVVYQGAKQIQNYVPAVQLLENVILRLDPSSSTLSFTHYYFIRCCMGAGAYTEATTVLDRPIYHVPTQESAKSLEKRLSEYSCSPQESSLGYINHQTGLTPKITTRIYLEYFLLGGMCYIATEQWAKARTLLQVVLATPSQQGTLSLIQLEAYKKWVLLGLLIDGNESKHSRLSSNIVKSLKTLAKPYECIVDAFTSNKMDVLQAEIQEGLDIWQDDGNYGLVAEVFAAFRKFSVFRLSRTFSALSIEEVATRTSPESSNVQETLGYLQALVSSGSLQAQITPSQTGNSLGTIRFLPPTASHKTEAQVEQELAAKSLQLQVLLKFISDYDHQLAVNKEYIESLLRAKKARDQEKKSGVTGGGKSLPGFAGPTDIDEEMMDDW